MMLLDALLRSSVVLLAGIAASLVLRRRPAALRHAVLAAIGRPRAGAGIRD